MPKVSRTWSKKRLQRTLAAQDAAGQPGQRGRLGARAGSLRRAPSRKVDHHGHRRRDQDEDDESEDVLRFGDGERVQRRGEVVVQQQRTEDRRHQGRCHAAHKGVHDGQGEEEQHLGGEPVGLSGRGEYGRKSRRAQDRERPTADQPTPAEAPRRPEQPGGADTFVGDEMDVDVARHRRHDRCDIGPEQVLEPVAPAAAHHQLGGVDPGGEVDQGGSHVVPHHLVVATTEVLDQTPQSGQCLRRGTGEAVVAYDVDGEEFAAGAAGGDAGGAADDCFAFGSAGDGDDDAFAGGPGGVDVVVGAVGGESFVDAVGDPEQGEFA